LAICHDFFQKISCRAYNIRIILAAAGLLQFPSYQDPLDLGCFVSVGHTHSY